jgi:hypothetical protein
VVPVNFTIRAQLTTDGLQITPSKLDFGKIYEGSASRISLTFENLSILMKELIFFPLPNEIKIEPDLIPIHILPKEKIMINIVFRGNEIKTEDTFLTAKIIDGTISTKDLRIPYACEVMKCPLEFSAKKIDFPALQIEEKVSTNISIKNTANKDIIIEFFLPDFQLCGLKMTTMVATIPSQKKIDVNLEYSSFFKKLGAFTLLDLQQKF